MTSNTLKENVGKTVKVGWVTKPELGTIECEVVEHWPDAQHQPRTVRWCKGRTCEISWCHSQQRYVFVPPVEAEAMRRSISTVEPFHGKYEVIMP